MSTGVFDWRGECAAIVASGPTAKTAGVEQLRDRIHVIAIKRTVELCPWADAVYGCDLPWWQSVQGLPNFKGRKFSWNDNAGGAKHYDDIVPVDIEVHSDQLLFDRPGVVGSGGNSGFQAINLAAQFGVRGILLVGFDMQDRGGVHWYGRNDWRGANNPTADNFRRWMVALDKAAPTLAAMDVQVFNASPASALTCFPHKTIAQALEHWGL